MHVSLETRPDLKPIILVFWSGHESHGNHLDIVGLMDLGQKHQVRQYLGP